MRYLFIYLFRCLDPSILRLTLITNTSHENAKLKYVSINKSYKTKIKHYRKKERSDRKNLTI